jgi:putative GTP pyrophosphokinase
VTESEGVVLFNGRTVSVGWSDRVKAAQEITSYEIGGKPYPRIPYGDESSDWGAHLRPCHDCAVEKGQFHVDGCDVEECPKCGGQSIACECSDEELLGGEFDFQKHQEKALNSYLLQRPLYEEICLVAKNILKQAIERNGIKLSSIEARAKEPDSFARKAMKPSETNPGVPKYPNPLFEITDLVGVRIITFFPESIARIDKIILDEFHVLERSDKAEKLNDEDRFGYKSIHYLAVFSPRRAILPEYEKYSNTVIEIQVRTILQHAWAEIEHDIQYKSASVIPREINRRFNALAGMLELADREFQAIQDEDVRLRKITRQMIKEGEIDEVEITPDALKVFLTRTIGGDQRIRWSSYDYLARALRKCGFRTLRQLEDCMRGYDGDRLSRLVYGFRQGQIIRCELVLLASMGELFMERHPWADSTWFKSGTEETLRIFKESSIEVGSFDPRSR